MVSFLVEGRFVKQPGLSRLFPVVWFIYRFDALQGEGSGGQVNWAAVAVFVILALPHQLGPEMGEGVRIIRSVEYRFLVHAPSRFVG